MQNAIFQSSSNVINLCVIHNMNQEENYIIMATYNNFLIMNIMKLEQYLDLFYTFSDDVFSFNMNPFNWDLY